jgi:aquaporin Z
MYAHEQLEECMADNDMMVPAREFNAENFLPESVLAEWIRPLISEAIGPFALVLIGAGSIMLAFAQGFSDGGTLLLVAFAHGLAIGLMIAATGHISGGHYNPAVTIGFWLGGKIGTLKAIGYIIAQLVGAVIAALVLRYIFNETIRDQTNFAIPSIAYAADAVNHNGLVVGRAHGFVLEFILTFFLMYVIIGTAVDERGPHAIASLAIGLTITMDILLAGPLTGAAMNPARHFGPALVHGEWKDAWLYWVAPIGGAAAASILQHYIMIPRAQQDPRPEPSEHHG